MKPDSVEFLESEVEQVLSRLFAELPSPELPSPELPVKRPTAHTVRMMAKAAVAVYEASAEPPRRPPRRRS